MNPRSASRIFAGMLAVASCADDTRSAASPDATLGTTTDVTAAESGGSPDGVAVPVDPYACTPASASAPLDEALDGSQARAGQIGNERELLGGEGAYGRVGHYKLYNNRVRFVVQGRVEPHGGARAVGYDLYGGDLIDADRVRAPGAPGGDLFREAFPLVGFRVGSVDDISVVCDGSGGRPAVVRVTGTDQPSRLLSFLDALALARDVQIVTRYILRPGSDALEIRTEVHALDGSALAGLSAGDFLSFGALTLFTDVAGFGNVTQAGGRPAYLVGASDPGEADRHVSYGIAAAAGTLAVPIVDASGAGALYDALTAPAGGRAEFVRYFSVGTGDVASAVAPLMALRHDPHGTVTGHTTPGALVYAYAGAYAAGAVVRGVARAEADGVYALPLPPGGYDLVAVDAGRARGAAVHATVADGATATADPSAGPTGTLVLDLAALGDTGTARVRTPMKVSLRGLDIEPSDAAMGDLEGEREAYGLQRAVYSLTGVERVTVKPGRYHAIVSHGEEWDTAEADVTVAPGGEAVLRADLARAFATPGAVAADFHQHTVGSVDSPRALCGRVLENVAEGLEFAATTDHDNVTDFGPCTRSLGLTSYFGSTPGNEISVVGVGHFNAYPLAVDPADPARLIGAQYWADLTIQQLFDRVRAEPSDPILHVSHPRSNGLKGYFSSLSLDPLTLDAPHAPLARGWEALEVNDSLGSPEEYLAAADASVRAQAAHDPTVVPVLHDLFALLVRGEHPCALGNSDTHQRNGGTGWPHNLVQVNEDRPDHVTAAMVRDAIRAQRVVVASGLVVTVRVGGAVHMGWRDVVAAPGGAVDLDIEVQAPPWVAARDLVVFENGRPLVLTADGAGAFRASADPRPGDALEVPLGPPGPPGAAGAVRFRATVHAHALRDSFYVVLARGASLEPVGRGAALGYTNPIYVDVDGNGWQPPVM